MYERIREKGRLLVEVFKTQEQEKNNGRSLFYYVYRSCA